MRILIFGTNPARRVTYRAIQACEIYNSTEYERIPEQYRLFWDFFYFADSFAAISFMKYYDNW